VVPALAQSDGYSVGPNGFSSWGQGSGYAIGPGGSYTTWDQSGGYSIGPDGSFSTWTGAPPAPPEVPYRVPPVPAYEPLPYGYAGSGE
jgi:hypothetical protein